jgi:hypothetical protein
MGAEFYRARAAEAMRKARADLFNSHIYREIAYCYERLAADGNERTLPEEALQDRAAGTNSKRPLSEGH